MSASYNYNELVAELKLWTENGSDEYDSAIPGIVGLAELRILRDLNIEYFGVTQDVTVTALDPLITKPTNTIVERELYYPVGTTLVRLEKRTRSYLMDYHPDASVTGIPEFFCDESDTKWRLAPTPAAGVTAKARTLVRPGGMADSNQTTWIGTKCGDALFYACMILSEKYIINDLPQRNFESEYERAMIGAITELRDARAQGYVPMAKNEGGNR